MTPRPPRSLALEVSAQIHSRTNPRRPLRLTTLDLLSGQVLRPTRTPLSVLMPLWRCWRGRDHSAASHSSPIILHSKDSSPSVSMTSRPTSNGLNTLKIWIFRVELFPMASQLQVSPLIFMSSNASEKAMARHIILILYFSQIEWQWRIYDSLNLIFMNLCLVEKRVEFYTFYIVSWSGVLGIGNPCQAWKVFLVHNRMWRILLHLDHFYKNTHSRIRKERHSSSIISFTEKWAWNWNVAGKTAVLISKFNWNVLTFNQKNSFS